MNGILFRTYSVKYKFMLYFLIFSSFVENFERNKKIWRVSSMLTNQSTIELLTKNENNLQINEDALKFIQGLQGPVCPCVIMGQYRTGKSFLLSRLFDSKSAFSVGHTDQPQTKGLWVSTEPIKVKGKTLDQQMNVILIDTEVLTFLDCLILWN